MQKGIYVYRVNLLIYATSGDHALLAYQSVETTIKDMQVKANETELMRISEPWETKNRIGSRLRNITRRLPA